MQNSEVNGKAVLIIPVGHQQMDKPVRDRIKNILSAKHASAFLLFTPFIKEAMQHW